MALHNLAALEYFNTPSMSHIFNSNGKRENMSSLLRGKDASIWNTSLANEFGRLAQGIKGRVTATDTIDFITQQEVPSHKKSTYINFICDHKPLKTEENRLRLIVGGDKLEYDYDTGSPAASLLETKLILNSTISSAHKGACFMCAHLKDYFLATFMLEPEYMKIQYKLFLEVIRVAYDLASKVGKNGYIHIKIKKGMYGLKQAAILAYTQLVNNLKPFGYYPCPYTAGLWVHKTKKTKFCLCRC